MNEKDRSVKTLIWYFSIGFIGFAFFFIYYPKLDDFTALKSSLRKDQIEQKVKALANKLNTDLDTLEHAISFERNDDLIEYSQKKYDLQKTTQLMDQNLPAYFWHVEYKPKKTEEDSATSTVVEIGSSSEQDRDKDENDKKNIVFEISSNGQLLSFQKNILPDTTIQTPTEEKNVQLAKKQLSVLSPDESMDWQLQQYEKKKIKWGTIHHYKWVSYQTDWADSLIASLDMVGDAVYRFNLSMGASGIGGKEEDGDYISGILTVIVFLIIAIMVLVNFIQRLRQDKIDFRNAWIIAIITAIAMIFNMVHIFTQESVVEILLAMIVASPFLGVVIFVLMSVSESVARDVWNDKLYSFDRILRFRIFSPYLGKNILAGLGLSGILLGVFSLLLWVGDHVGPSWINYDESEIMNFAFSYPYIYNIGSNWLRASFVVIGIVLFVFSHLRRFMNNNVVFYLIAGIVFSLLPLRLLDTRPIYIPVIINFLIGILLLWAFIRFEFITSFVAMISTVSFVAAIPYLIQNSLTHVTSGVLSLFFPLGFLIIGIVAVRNTETEESTAEFVPAYLKRWRERERLQRELEIARTVQLKFLPQSQPDIGWLDIASTCVPAYEVGGDYYDFLQLDENRFGVVVGDVSGKGVSAAFYMTLMKGILKSQTQLVRSPKQILMQINDLFYQNAQRGVFISLIYGIFDREKGTFTFARAGHNPLITHYQQKNHAEQLSPKGIAIGLDKGAIFNESLQEREIHIGSGDVLVFYTDGYSEAMDKDRYEFGEQRLIEIVNKNAQYDGQVILNRIQDEVERFAGEATQHDDMTMIVVKIRELQ